MLSSNNIRAGQHRAGVGGVCDYILLFCRLQRATDTICETSDGLITSPKSAVKLVY